MDIASTTTALTGSISSDFRFTGLNDTVNAITATMQVGDTLLDNSTTDNDVINITSTGPMNAITAVNIETANVTMASGTPTAVFTSFTGLNTVNVSGSVAGTVVDAGTAAISVSSYGRILTIQSDMVGTTAASSADIANVTMSGATFGTTTATQSGLVFDNTNANAQVLETLNITSSGAAANVFSLASSNDTTFSTINVGGTAAATLRVANADVSGLTVNGTGGTGALTLSIGSAGDVVTNAFNWTGVDDIIFRDTDTTAHAVTLNNVTSGQLTTLASDAGAVSISVSGATASAPAAALTLVLDNGTAATDLDVTSVNIQNVTALNLVSSGFAASSATTAENSIGALAGDFTSIVVTGDTSLDLDLNIDAPSSGTRAVTVNASGMTGTSFLDAAVENATTAVSYTVTGTGRNDTINMANALSSTINAGAGNDTITGSAGVDTINAGAGNDTIIFTAGADRITLGDGVDTIDINNTAPATAAVRHVIITGDADATLTSVAADDDFIVTVNGTSYKQDVLANGDTGQDITGDFVAAFAATILADHGVTVTQTAAAATTGLTFTGATTGVQFTATAQFIDNGVSVATGGGVTVAGVLGTADFNSTITDFSSVDKIDTVGLGDLGTGGYYEGAAGAAVAATDYGVMVITDTAYADFGAAEAAVAARMDANTDDVIMIFLNSTSGRAEAYFDTDTGADNNVAATDLLLTFENITNLTDLASIMSADSFII